MTMDCTTTFHLPSCSAALSRLGLALQETNITREPFLSHSVPHHFSQVHLDTRPRAAPTPMDQVSLLELLKATNTWPCSTHPGSKEVITSPTVSASPTSSLTSILDTAFQAALSFDEFYDEEFTQNAIASPLPRQ